MISKNCVLSHLGHHQDPLPRDIQRQIVVPPPLPRLGLADQTTLLGAARLPPPPLPGPELRGVMLLFLPPPCLGGRPSGQLLEVINVLGWLQGKPLFPPLNPSSPDT